jgi:hypothetical protein
MHIPIVGAAAAGAAGVAGGGRGRGGQQPAGGGGARAGGEGDKAWRVVQPAPAGPSYLEIDTLTFDVSSEDVVLKSKDVLATLRFTLDIKPIKDFFNDKLRYE